MEPSKFLVENARLDFRAQKSRKPRGGMAQAVPPFLFAALKRRVKRLLPINHIWHFITSLTNTGPVVVAAHSLGNMVTLSAISDWNAPISQYFMMDSAVPIEAIDPAAVTNMMIYSTWTTYTNRLFASDWYKLFPTNDACSTLFWNDRLGKLGDVENSGESVQLLNHISIQCHGRGKPNLCPDS